MRVSLYCFLSNRRNTRSSERGSVGTGCTIGTEVTHAGYNWMGAGDEYLVGFLGPVSLLRPGDAVALNLLDKLLPRPVMANQVG